MFYLFWGYHFCPGWCSIVQSWETTENDGWGPATYEYPTAHIGGVEDPQGFHDFSWVSILEWSNFKFNGWV